VKKIMEGEKIIIKRREFARHNVKNVSAVGIIIIIQFL